VGPRGELLPHDFVAVANSRRCGCASGWWGTRAATTAACVGASALFHPAVPLGAALPAGRFTQNRGNLAAYNEARRLAELLGTVTAEGESHRRSFASFLLCTRLPTLSPTRYLAGGAALDPVPWRSTPADDKRDRWEIEHIFPQQAPHGGARWPDGNLHSLGNLLALNPPVNAEAHNRQPADGAG
jgi:hypothetical protein